MSIGAPHKGAAILDLLKNSELQHVFYIGDDDTDEDVFSLPSYGPGQVMTVRKIGFALIASIALSGCVAGMSRMMQANVIATSGRAVEAAGDVDVLLLDKTGTITEGRPRVTDVRSLGPMSPDHVLRIAASLDGGSDHPVARAPAQEPGPARRPRRCWRGLCQIPRGKAPVPHARRRPARRRAGAAGGRRNGR